MEAMRTWKLYSTATLASIKALSFQRDMLELVSNPIFRAIVWNKNVFINTVSKCNKLLFIHLFQYVAISHDWKQSNISNNQKYTLPYNYDDIL